MSEDSRDHIKTIQIHHLKTGLSKMGTVFDNQKVFFRDLSEDLPDGTLILHDMAIVNIAYDADLDIIILVGVNAHNAMQKLKGESPPEDSDESDWD
jgi:hypothetical protein